jgi:hypothetical protein
MLVPRASQHSSGFVQRPYQDPPSGLGRVVKTDGEVSMISVIWLGALLVLSGVLFMAAQAIWRGRLSGRRSRSMKPSDTLEPREPGAGFGLAANWPGFALIALGAILLLAGGWL